MLFILYGAALEVGLKSREIFEKKGFEIIGKDNYIETDSNIKTWLNDKKFVDRSKLESCDFQYELNGLHVGFNKTVKASVWRLRYNYFFIRRCRDLV